MQALLGQHPEVYASATSPALEYCYGALANFGLAEVKSQDATLMKDAMDGFMLLPMLDVGEAIVAGDAVLLPSHIKVTPPDEKPLSASVGFWTEWSRPEPKPDWSLAAENMRRQRRRPS